MQLLLQLLICPNAIAAMEWYQQVFNAKEKMRLMEPGGKAGTW